ncbi:MAG TPA: type VI secretion system tip protein VgrG [Janthinobacterium sp.]|nr:type VI secretion system tip protein VgrG [Janthinobacterium sp.]
MIANRQENRLLRLSFPQKNGPTAMMVANRLDAFEGLSRDFRFTVEVISDDARIELKDMQGKMVTVELVREDRSIRYFNGNVFDFRMLRTDGGLAFYEMVLAPWMADLNLRRDNYLFHGRSVLEQTDDIFRDYLVDWKCLVGGTDPAMTDAHQYDESDHNYLHRRWEARGFFYWYEHRKDGHTLILCDDSTRVKPIDGAGPDIAFQRAAGAQEDDAIGEWSALRRIVPSRVMLTSFDFKNPVKNASVRSANAPTKNKQGDVPALEVYEYAGAYGFKNKADGRAQADLRMEEIEAVGKHFEAAGNDRTVQPGRWFRLTGHFDIGQPGKDSKDSEFLVIEVTHSASNNYQVAAGIPAHYENRLKCIRKMIPWRPGRGFNSTQPKIYGLTTAIVVGPPGEEIHTDQYGRVRVQFHWDQVGQYDQQSSAWVRVATASSGPNFGMSMIPRVGSECVVQFLGGNPDLPLITAMVPNAATMPATFSGIGTLPGNLSLSGIKSNGLKSGGHNQLRLDDTADQLSAQLASTSGATQLNLGHLTHPRDQGQGKARGNGIELATNESGAIRTAKSLLLTAWKRLDVSGKQLSSEEHLGLMQDCLDLFKTLGQYAFDHQALAIDDQPQTELKDDVKAAAAGSNTDPSGVGGKPTISVTAPDGIALSTPRTIVSYAGINVDTVAQRHMQLTSGQRFNVNAGKGISLFSHKDGIKQIAHYGRFEIQAQHDSIALAALKDVTITASEGVVRIVADKGIELISGGSYLKLGGGHIENGCEGDFIVKAGEHVWSGPASMKAELPKFGGVATDQRFQIFYDLHSEMQQIAADQHYRITLDDDSIVEGQADAQGRTELLQKDAMRIAHIEIIKKL